MLDAYQLLTGRAAPNFAFYRVLSLFRSAIVFLQLFERSRRRPERELADMDFDLLGHDLLDYAWMTSRGQASI